MSTGALHVAVCFQDAAADAARARRDRARRSRRGAVPRPAAARSPEGRQGPAPVEGPRRPPLGRAVARGDHRPRLRAAGFTPAIRYVSRDPLANRGLVAAGLAVTISPAELAAEFSGIAVEPLRDGPKHSRLRLLPATGASPLARAFVGRARWSVLGAPRRRSGGRRSARAAPPSPAAARRRPRASSSPPPASGSTRRPRPSTAGRRPAARARPAARRRGVGGLARAAQLGLGRLQLLGQPRLDRRAARARRRRCVQIVERTRDESWIEQERERHRPTIVSVDPGSAR